MNYTWPGRIHLIWTRRTRLYVTVWLFGKRLHWTGASGVVVRNPPPRSLWDMD